jgi:hypothetical protein
MSDINELCLVNLIVSDLNDDGQLSVSEYKEFATLLGFPESEELPAILETRFYSLACLCGDSIFDGQADPSTCCNNENAVISLSLARQSSEYLGNVCIWTESSIAIAMESLGITASPSTPSPTSAMPSTNPNLRPSSRPSVLVSASINAVSAPAARNDHSGLSSGAFTALMCVAAIGFISFFVFGLVFAARRQRRKGIETDGIDDSRIAFYGGSNMDTSISPQSNGQNGSKSKKRKLSSSTSMPLAPIAEHDEKSVKWPTYTYLKDVCPSTDDLQTLSNGMEGDASEGDTTIGSNCSTPRSDASPRADPSSTSAIIGTPARAAPEQDLEGSSDGPLGESYRSPIASFRTAAESVNEGSFRTSAESSPSSFTNFSEPHTPPICSLPNSDDNRNVPSPTASVLLRNVLGQDNPESPYRSSSPDSSLVATSRPLNPQPKSSQIAAEVVEALTGSYSSGDGSSDEDDTIVVIDKMYYNHQLSPTRLAASRSPNDVDFIGTHQSDSWYQNQLFPVPPKSDIESDGSDGFDGVTNDVGTSN